MAVGWGKRAPPLGLEGRRGWRSLGGASGGGGVVSELRLELRLEWWEDQLRRTQKSNKKT